MAAGPKLPSELRTFKSRPANFVIRKKIGDVEKLHDIELKDVGQQIKMRPFVASFFGVLLLAQNIAVFWIVWWSLSNDKLEDLQLIFSVLVSATLLETYKVSQIIVNRLFEQIDYKDKHGRFKSEQEAI